MVKVNSTVSVGVEVGESGVVSHVGLWALGGFADRLGLGAALSEAFGKAKVVHDRGSVLVHAMLMLAGGGEACTDVEHLRAEPDLFGEAASDSTLPRPLRTIET
ncbi:MAG: transposase, partial [bacterium]|nr:transposase [bacterium]